VVESVVRPFAAAGARTSTGVRRTPVFDAAVLGDAGSRGFTAGVGDATRHFPTGLSALLQGGSGGGAGLGVAVSDQAGSAVVVAQGVAPGFFEAEFAGLAGIEEACMRGFAATGNALLGRRVIGFLSGSGGGHEGEDEAEDSGGNDAEPIEVGHELLSFFVATG